MKIVRTNTRLKTNQDLKNHNKLLEEFVGVKD